MRLPTLPRLTPTEMRYAAYGAGALAAVGLGYAFWPKPLRTRVTDAATSRLGSSDAAEFWKDVLAPGYPPSSYPVDWCGGFALWCLHQAGLGLGIQWVVGVGFLAQLPTTKSPLPGDIAYFNNNQHHAVVTDLLGNNRLGLVNGNGTGGKVSASSIDASQAAAFYSIQPLIAAVDDDGSVLPWMLASGAVLGTGAWLLLPSGRSGK